MSVSFEVRLLGQVNRSLAADPNSRVCPKYVITVNAAQLAQWLRYKKVGKKTPYQIDPMSLIKLDKTAQRGLTDDGFALQDESKVVQIRDALLGVSKEAARLYVGTLVWNVRPAPNNALKVLVEMDPDQPHLPPALKLRITADSVWLTDSAHRHFGIVEAVSAWQKDLTKYPTFSDSFEFSVDLYNLDAVQENALFRELNAKQKKISASKAQHTDTGSALGLLKSTILAKDQADLKLFDQNIEVNANENTRHTLMTMSVFTASVQGMFGKALIDEARTSTTLRDELAQYYCDFFYALRKNIRVIIERRGEQKEVTPFQNLYESIIAPAIDKMADETDEDKINTALKTAREKAKLLNQDIQREEKIHSNAVVKALSRIAGRIMYMRDWTRVIDLLQSSLIAANGGKYFQKSNLTLQQSVGGAVPIATKKASDDSINIQVQDQTIREIERHLNEKLHLEFVPKVYVTHGGSSIEAPDERIALTPTLSRTGDTYIDFEVQFEVGADYPLGDEELKLRIQSSLPSGVQWKNVDKIGKQRLVPASVEEVPGYDHPYYPGGFTRYSAKFEITLPQYNDPSPATIDLNLDVEIVELNGNPFKLKRVLPLQPAP